MMSASMSNKMSVSVASLACLVLIVGQFTPGESKLLRPSRNYYDDSEGYGSYGGGGYGSGRTGERAIVTVRGARDTYSGLPPRHLSLESSPYAGGYPRGGIYDRLDSYGGRRPGGLMPDLVPVGPGSYGGSRFDRYRMNSYDRPVYDDAPQRIAVTGVYPTYGGRF